MLSKAALARYHLLILALLLLVGNHVLAEDDHFVVSDGDTINRSNDSAAATTGDLSLMPGFQGDLVPGDLVTGNCNHLIDGISDLIDAGDITALASEIFDGDGNAALDAMQGTFEGHPGGCDANEDGVVDAGDIACLMLIIFEGPGSCGSGVTNTMNTAALSRAVVVEQNAQVGDCNADGQLDAGDIAALALEMNDADGVMAFATTSGSFSGAAQGCDVNSDGVIDPQDLNELATLIFG